MNRNEMTENVRQEVHDEKAVKSQPEEMEEQEKIRQEEFIKKEEARVQLFDRFEQQLTAGAGAGEAPVPCSAEISENAELQNRRLQNHGLTLYLKLKDRQELDRGSGNGYVTGSENEQQQIDFEVYNRHHNRTRTYCRQGRKIKKIKDTVWLTQVISQAETAQSAQVTAFGWSELDHLSITNHNRRVKQFWMITLGVLLVLSLILFLFQIDFFSVIFVDLMLAYLMLMIRLCWLPIRILAATIANFAIQHAHDKKMAPGYKMWAKIEEQIQHISIACVEHVALTLAEKRIFESSRPDDPFYDILDIRYRDIPCFTEFENGEDGFKIGINLYVTNTVVENEKIHLKHEILAAQLWHEGPVTPQEAFAQRKFGKWTLLNLQRLN